MIKCTSNGIMHIMFVGDSYSCSLFLSIKRKYASVPNGLIPMYLHIFTKRGLSNEWRFTGDIFEKIQAKRWKNLVNK